MKRKPFFSARNIAYLAVLVALLIVLQLFASAIPMFGVTLNFSLIPIFQDYYQDLQTFIKLPRIDDLPYRLTIEILSGLCGTNSHLILSTQLVISSFLIKAQ